MKIQTRLSDWHCPLKQYMFLNHETPHINKRDADTLVYHSVDTFLSGYATVASFLGGKMLMKPEIIDPKSGQKVD